MATREIFWNIGEWGYILYGLLVPLAIILAYGIYQRYRLWRVGQPDNRLDNLPQQIWSFTVTGVVDGLIHRRFLREPYPGLIHFLIFWGALFFLLAAFLDFFSHYIFEFMQGAIYLGISFSVDAVSYTHLTLPTILLV